LKRYQAFIGPKHEYRVAYLKDSELYNKLDYVVVDTMINKVIAGTNSADTSRVLADYLNTLNGEGVS